MLACVIQDYFLRGGNLDSHDFVGRTVGSDQGFGAGQGERSWGDGRRQPVVRGGGLVGGADGGAVARAAGGGGQLEQRLPALLAMVAGGGVGESLSKPWPMIPTSNTSCSIPPSCAPTSTRPGQKGGSKSGHRALARRAEHQAAHRRRWARQSAAQSSHPGPSARHHPSRSARRRPARRDPDRRQGLRRRCLPGASGRARRNRRHSVEPRARPGHRAPSRALQGTPSRRMLHQQDQRLPPHRHALRQNRPGLPLHDLHRLHDGLAQIIVHRP